jgi:branched-subunit amino acid ABC-type transport system permease component
MTNVVQYGIDAVSLGSLYALFALGLALIFGVMRLVNFAHGELIMAGTYCLVLIDLPAPALIPLTVLLVVVLALAMERIAFRPVRHASPATLLITSFALSFLIQNVAQLTWGSLPRTTDFLPGLSTSFTIGSIRVQWLDVVTVALTIGLLFALAYVLHRTTIGIQMRAAADDFRVARVLGVRADSVIATAFAISGLLAAAGAVLLVARTGTATPTDGVNGVFFGFVATIVGGMGSLVGAVIGGFLVGAATVVLQASLPLELRTYRDAFVFAAVLIVLVVRPQGLLPSRLIVGRDVPRTGRLADLALTALRRRPRPARPPGAGARSPRLLWERSVWPPLALMAVTSGVALVAWGLGSDSLDRVVIGMVINMIVVVGLYTYVGTSGVFSFGHAAFMAIGAYTGALCVIPGDTKAAILPDLPGFLANLHLAPFPATLLAGGVSGLVALVLSAPLARLSGLTAGLATFALLNITNVVARNWQEVTRGTAGIAGIPTTTTIGTALGWALTATTVAWVFQRSRVGLRLRASREDEAAARAVGIGVALERRVALVLSAFFVGAGGAVYGMFIGSFNPDAFFLGITFLVTAMLIVGGMTSLTGAVLGTIVISAVDELLRRVEEGVDLGPVSIPARSGLREVGLALAMLAILILRPSGLTAGREIGWRRATHTKKSLS